MTVPRLGFFSDNNSGVHPKVMAAIAKANSGPVLGYGNDPITASARTAFGRHFGPNTKSFIVFNGTGAKVLPVRANRGKLTPKLLEPFLEMKGSPHQS